MQDNNDKDLRKDCDFLYNSKRRALRIPPRIDDKTGRSRGAPPVLRKANGVVKKFVRSDELTPPIYIDSELDLYSGNPVKNSVVTEAFLGLDDGVWQLSGKTDALIDQVHSVSGDLCAFSVYALQEVGQIQSDVSSIATQISGVSSVIDSRYVETRDYVERISSVVSSSVSSISSSVSTLIERSSETISTLIIDRTESLSSLIGSMQSAAIVSGMDRSAVNNIVRLTIGIGVYSIVDDLGTGLMPRVVSNLPDSIEVNGLSGDGYVFSFELEWKTASSWRWVPPQAQADHTVWLNLNEMAMEEDGNPHTYYFKGRRDSRTGECTLYWWRTE